MQPKFYITFAKAVFNLSLLVLFYFLPSSVSAQSAPLQEHRVEISNDSIPSVLKIKYSSFKEVYSFLVLITDSKGNTMFLENNHRFNGNYLRHIDLSKSIRGEFTVNIICDEQKISKKIIIP